MPSINQYFETDFLESFQLIFIINLKSESVEVEVKERILLTSLLSVDIATAAFKN